MKKWLAIILSIICAVNLLACSGEQTDSAFEQSGMIDEAERIVDDANFATLKEKVHVAYMKCLLYLYILL